MWHPTTDVLLRVSIHLQSVYALLLTFAAHPLPNVRERPHRRVAAFRTVSIVHILKGTLFSIGCWQQPKPSRKGAMSEKEAKDDAVVVEAAESSNTSEAVEEHASVPEDKKVPMPSQHVTCSSRLAYSPRHAQLAR